MRRLINAGEGHVGNIKTIEEMCAAIKNGVRCAVVTGTAGTGKTTLIRDLVPTLSAMRYDVKLLVPTGRAAKMIQVRTGHPASTIHSAIFHIADKPFEDVDGTIRWQFPLKDDHPARTVFIVDEASMVGTGLHNDGILEFGTGSLLQDLLDYSGIRRFRFRLTANCIDVPRMR